MEQSPTYLVYNTMKRIPQTNIRKYCRDQRFKVTYKRHYQDIEYRFRITNISNEYNDTNPLCMKNTWECVNINIVIDGTVRDKNRKGEVYTEMTLADRYQWQLNWNPRGPRKTIRRDLESGVGGYGRRHDSSDGHNPFHLFLKCMNLGNNDIKIGTIKFGTV